MEYVIKIMPKKSRSLVYVQLKFAAYNKMEYAIKIMSEKSVHLCIFRRKGNSQYFIFYAFALRNYVGI